MINYSTTILFSEFDYTSSKHWLSLRRPFFVLLALFYPPLAFSVQLLLNHFPHFNSSPNVRFPLIAWNALLALFSAFGFYRITPIFLRMILSHGIVHTYTHMTILQTDQTSGYWTFLWVLSKAPELFDTFFIVLKRKPLRFMHCILFGLVNFVGDNAYLVWVVWMNFLVHLLMYSYFFVTSLAMRPLKLIAQFVTSLQLIQFFVILFQLGHIFLLHYLLGRECAISHGGLAIGVFTTAIYTKLWLQFYKENYLMNAKKTI